MKRLRKTEEFLFRECVSDDIAKVGETFIVSRKENLYEIVWYGLNTNWKYVFEDKKWYMLKGTKFIESNIPEYERKYLNDIRSDKIKNIVLNNE